MAMPKKMVAGSAVGLFGGIIALAVMAATWDGTLDCIVKVGLAMLVSVSFFAAAGTFMKYSPVQGSTMVVLSALAVAFTLVALIYGAMSIGFGLVLIVLGIVAILCAACPTVTSWVDANRRV